MSVIQYKPEDILPDFDFDNLEQFIKDDILSDNPSMKIKSNQRGKKTNNTYKNCKHHNLAVNAKFEKIIVNGEKVTNQFNNLRNSLLNFYLDCGIELRNFVWYKKGDYMGWHTNKYQTGQRVYLIWSEEDKKSSFDYYEKGKKKSILAPKGFSINTFYCGDFERMLTHQVTSDCNRISIGFRLR